MSPVRSPAPLPQGQRAVPDGEGSWMAVGCQNPPSPLLPLPTALSLSSYSGFPHRAEAPRPPPGPSVGPSCRGGGGSRRWDGAQRPPSAPVGRVAEKGPAPGSWGRVLLALGSCLVQKDAPKPLSISRCVNMAKKISFFYSFSVRYTRLYIYIYTYIPLYIDIYRYTHIYYLRLSLLEALYVAVGFQR